MRWTFLVVMVSGCGDVPDTVGAMCTQFADAFCSGLAGCEPDDFSACTETYVRTCCADGDTCRDDYTGGISARELETCLADVEDCACEADATGVYEACIFESCRHLDD